MGFGETTTSCSVKSWSLVVCPCSSVNFLSVVVYKLFMSWHLEFALLQLSSSFFFFYKKCTSCSCCCCFFKSKNVSVQVARMILVVVGVVNHHS